MDTRELNGTDATFSFPPEVWTDTGKASGLAEIVVGQRVHIADGFLCQKDHKECQEM